MSQTNPADLLLAVKALAQIQGAVARYLHPNGGNKDQFIDEVLAAADDKEVVRAMKGLKEQAAFLDSFHGQIKTLAARDAGSQDAQLSPTEGTARPARP